MAIVVLVLNPEGGEGSYIQLEERPYVIGRAEGSDIELDSSSVSRRHAKIYPAAGKWFLEDLDSRNGTSINGRRISSGPLEEGVLFGVGVLTSFFFTESSLDEIKNLEQNFPRLRERALKQAQDLAMSQKPLLAPSEKIPLLKTNSSSFELGKKLSTLSDIASGKLNQTK